MTFHRSLPPQVVSAMIEAAEIGPGHRVASLCSGDGEIAIHAARLAERVHAFDLDVSPLKDLAYPMVLPNLICHKADVLALDQVYRPGYWQFDSVLIDPPWNGAREGAYIERAAQLVCDNGVLVAWLSPGVVGSVMTYHADWQPELAIRQHRSSWLQSFQTYCYDYQGGTGVVFKARVRQLAPNVSVKAG